MQIVKAVGTIIKPAKKGKNKVKRGAILIIRTVYIKIKKRLI